MIRSRWLSTFTVIGALLMVLGVVGLVLGHRFVYDPGQVSDGNEPWYYILVGVLMIVNGIFSPAPDPAEKADDEAVEYGDKAVKRETAPPA